MFLYQKDKDYYVIDFDEYIESPREYDNLFSFYGWHRRYNSPDDNPYTPEEFNDEILHNDDYICYCVSMYDHSGVWFRLSKRVYNSFGDVWDSGIFGFMVVSKEDLKTFFKVDDLTEEILDEAYKYAENELQYYENYANGNCYMWEKVEVKTYTADDGDKHYELVDSDSCGGYYSLESVLGDLHLSDDNECGTFYRTDEIISYIQKEGEDE